MSEQETNTDTDIPMSLGAEPTTDGNESSWDMARSANGDENGVDDDLGVDLDLDPRQPVLTSARGDNYHLPRSAACDRPVCNSTCEKGWREKTLIMVDAGYDSCDQCIEVAVKADGAVHLYVKEDDDE